MKSIKKNAFYALLRGIVQTIIPFFVFAYASRILMPEGIGKINFANTFVGYFILIGGLGINKYGTREGAKCRQDRKAFSQLTVELLSINGVMTVLALILFIIIVFYENNLTVYRNILWIYGLAIPLSTLNMEWVYYSYEEYEFIAKRVAIFRIMGFLLTILLVKKKSDILIFAFIQVLSSYGNYLLNFYHVKKYISLKTIKELRIVRHIQPIMVLFMAQISYYLYSSVDITMLGLMISDWEVGIYSVAFKIIHILLSACEMAVSVIMPRVTVWETEKRKELIEKYQYKLINITFMILIPIVMGLIVWGRIIIILFVGNDYINTYPVLCILSVDLLLFNIRIIFETTFLIPNKKDKVVAVSMISAAIVNIALNYFLIPLGGGLGAAMASIISESVIAIAYINYFKKMKNTIRFMKTIKQYIAGGIMIFLIWIGLGRITDQIVFQACATTFFGAVAYITILLMNKNQYFYEAIGIFRKKRH